MVHKVLAALWRFLLIWLGTLGLVVVIAGVPGLPILVVEVLHAHHAPDWSFGVAILLVLVTEFAVIMATASYVD